MYGGILAGLFTYLLPKIHIDISHGLIDLLGVFFGIFLSFNTIRLIQYFMKAVIKGFNSDDVGI